MLAKEFTFVGKCQGIKSSYSFNVLSFISSIKSERFSSMNILKGSFIVVVEKDTDCWNVLVFVRHSSVVPFFLYVLNPGADEVFSVLVKGFMVMIRRYRHCFNSTTQESS